MATVRTGNVLRIGSERLEMRVGCRSNECRIQNKLQAWPKDGDATGPGLLLRESAAPGYCLRITTNVAVTTVDGSPIVKIGND